MTQEPLKITLKAARVNAGLTQEEAAKAIGISARTYLSWEKDPSQISAKFQAIIEDVFHISVNSIIFLEMM